MPPDPSRGREASASSATHGPTPELPPRPDPDTGKPRPPQASPPQHEATRTKTPERSDVGATILGHLLGWPLYAFGLFFWGITVIPVPVHQARGAPIAGLDQGLAGLGTGACLVASGLGLLLIASAVGKRRYGFQWMLVAVYGVALFFGLVVTSN